MLAPYREAETTPWLRTKRTTRSAANDPRHLARSRAARRGYAPWHFLYFLPDPHQLGTLRPILSRSKTTRCFVATAPPPPAPTGVATAAAPPAPAAAIASAPARDWCS